jgi:succinate dehydrogenase / fumarate reductase iron-sulfur subunit
MLFVSAKVKHINILPQGQPERQERTVAMLKAMADEGFGRCTNEFECEAVCPKEISVEHIAFLNREYLRARVVMAGLKAVITQE